MRLGMNAGRLDLFGRAAELIRERLSLVRQRGPDRFGLAHCDLRLDNLLIDNGEIKVIDFDDCGFSWYMYRTRRRPQCRFTSTYPRCPASIERWLEGYRTVSAVGRAEEEEIPTFVMLRRLLLVACGSDPTEKRPLPDLWELPTPSRPVTLLLGLPQAFWIA